MENQQTPRRHALALATALLNACAAVPVAVAPPAQLEPAKLGVTQVGAGQHTRYVYCEEDMCPAPTRKTPLAQPPLEAMPASSVRSGLTRHASQVIVEVAFPFNSPRISQADQSMLAQAASAHPGARVDITTRSDFVGPPAGQEKVMAARAQAMRRIVVNQSHGARITERREVAGPTRVTEPEQAQQRKGTVRFNTPIDVQLKGSPK